MDPAPPALASGVSYMPGRGYVLPDYPFVEPPELRSGAVQRHPIVIVGAGLSGLTLACGLARLGLSVVLLDEDHTVGVKGAASRGICYTQKSLEIFQRLGVYERIAAKGVQWSVGRTFAGPDEIYAFDLRQNSSYSLSAQPPFINIQQFYIEAYLVERLHELGHTDLRWHSRVMAFQQHAGFASLTVETPAGRYTLEAEHVIDASGAHSPFHAWTGVGLQTRRGDDRWCIVDVRFKTTPPKERHTWIEAPFNQGRAVWQHLMADEVWRIDYQMAPKADPEAVSRPEVVRERLQEQFGPGVDFEIVWVGPYAYRSQCVDQLRLGSVFFLGDAVKIVSPFGARGGNSGIADADNLAWKLAAVLRGQAPAELLASYHTERHEAALQNVHVTQRTARFLRPAEGMERTLRTAAITLARQYPFARAFINTGRMAVANSYTQSAICERSGGLSVQNVHFRWADRSSGCVNDLIAWAGGQLLVLVFGEISAVVAQRLRDLALATDVLCVQVVARGTRPQAVEHVIDPEGHLQGACHVFGHAWALLRPDAYIAATGESVDADLVRAIEKALAIEE